MTTKMKATKTKIRTATSKGSNSTSKDPNKIHQQKSIDSRDLNDSEQHRVTNAEHEDDFDDARVGNSNLDRQNSGDQNTVTVEEEEDREKLRKEDDAQGKEQV